MFVLLLQEETLALRKEGIGVVLDSELPHLIGIDDDLLSTGIILYHLKVRGHLTHRESGLEERVLVFRLSFFERLKTVETIPLNTHLLSSPLHLRRDGRTWAETTRPPCRTSVSLSLDRLIFLIAFPLFFIDSSD